MARRDEQVPTNWLSPVDALRRMQELSAQFVDGTRAFSERDDGDDDEAPSSGPSPVTAWAERAAEMSTMWVSPMRAMLEEQQELIDAISSWADSQRELADRFSALADRHREVTDGVLAALDADARQPRSARRAHAAGEAGVERALVVRFQGVRPQVDVIRGKEAVMKQLSGMDASFVYFETPNAAGPHLLGVDLRPIERSRWQR